MELWRGDHGVGIGVGALERGGGDFVGYATRRRGKEAKREGKGKKGKKREKKGWRIWGRTKSAGGDGAEKRSMY